MPAAESFDAFYARTVGSITHQMHTLAGADSAADHAIREAYAQAYQQWYQVSSHPDPEGWVLEAARDAYQRRRAEAVPTLGEQASAGPSSLSWPGLYRPAPGSPPWEPAPPVDDSDWSAAGQPAGVLPGGDSTIGAIPAGITTSPRQLDPRQFPPRQPGPRQHGPRQLGPRQQGPRRPGSGGRLLPFIAAIAVILAGSGLYLALAQRQGNSASHGPATQPSQSPAVPILGFGKVGSLGQVPWTGIGPGWALAEVSSGPAASPQAGPITTYLVDPKGGAYQIQRAPAGPRLQLLAWSGDHDHALYAQETGSSAGLTATYRVLSLRTGTMAALPLPASTTAVGFSRPDGANILAVHETATAFQLQRYDLLGKFQKTIGTLPRKPDAPQLLPGCTLQMCAQSSPDGKTDVWGVAGHRMQVVGNATGAAVKNLATGTGSPPSCVPMTWWDAATVLSSCAVTGQPSASQLWLVPANGAAP
ncbi:MAG: hypothetical protein J2P29_11715, partial [Actinobacteria bacterium]|nr:hypothetical protein [Actinomycetota bacterium]